jgi:hypothetical protein
MKGRKWNGREGRREGRDRGEIGEIGGKGREGGWGEGCSAHKYRSTDVPVRCHSKYI